MARGIAVDWIKHLKTDKEKAEFSQALINSHLIDRLRELLLEKENNLLNQETNPTDYDSASWAYKQADRNGYRRCLKQITDLVNFKE